MRVCDGCVMGAGGAGVLDHVQRLLAGAARHQSHGRRQARIQHPGARATQHRDQAHHGSAARVVQGCRAAASAAVTCRRPPSGKARTSCCSASRSSGSRRCARRSSPSPPNRLRPQRRHSMCRGEMSAMVQIVPNGLRCFKGGGRRAACNGPALVHVIRSTCHDVYNEIIRYFCVQDS